MEHPTLSGLDHLVLTVRNIDTTVAFYTNVLGMTHTPFRVADGSTRHALGFGTQKINLHQADNMFDPKAAHPTKGSADLCFLTDIAIDRWQVHFRTTGTEIEDGPVARTGARFPIISLYVRDPDGNLIEVSTRA